MDECCHDISDDLEKRGKLDLQLHRTHFAMKDPNMRMTSIPKNRRAIDSLNLACFL